MSKKVVYDTNVIVSAQLKSGSWPALVLDLGLQKEVRAFVSTVILQEYEGVLLRDKFDLDKGKVNDLMDLFKEHFELVEPKQEITAAFDEDDNKFLECAQEADADFLITGNKKDFPESFKETKVVNPVEFALHFIEGVVNSN